MQGFLITHDHHKPHKAGFSSHATSTALG